jgi:primosomal protein N' (replication factor Y) (superfamily II helicase)
MYLLSISPFSKAFRKEELWYFSSFAVEVGKIVSITLRNKTIKGLVLACEQAKDKKSEIRQSDFAIKKIVGVSKNQFLNKAFIEAANETANYFATSTGSVLNALIPKNFIESYSKYNYELNIESQAEHGKFIVQLPDEERYSEYKSLIRGRFAKNQSVIFCVPTNEDINIAYQKLSKGIESSTFLLNNQIPQKDFLKTWEEIMKSEKPLLLILTSQFLFTPIKKLGLIIIERENSGAYKIQQRPYVDIRFFAETYAKNLKSDFLLGDLMLRSETLKRYDEHHFFEYTPIKFRLVSTSKNLLINTNKELNPGNSNFSPISFDLRSLIKKSLKENKKTFLLVSRKGLAPLVVCADCGQMVKCKDCNSSVTLFGKDATKKENVFKCKHCNATRSAGELCSNCQSWRLMALGIGTESVYEEIQNLFPEAKTFIIDKEKTKTPLQAKKIIENFYNEPAGILIGTEMALLYLNEEIDNVAIVSIDALFSLPDYRIKERILNILLKSKIKARDNFLIQSRNAGEKIFQQAIDGNLSEFYREEFIQRKKYNYPPFSLMIKFNFKETTKIRLDKLINETVEILKPFEIFIYDSFVEKQQGKFTMNGLIKINKSDWPNKNLKEKIQNLPPNIDVIVEADSAI